MADITNYIMVRYCEYCKKEIDENNTYGKGRFCNKRCQILSISDKGTKSFQRNASIRKQKKTIRKVCPNCGIEFETILGRHEKKFCSVLCSSKYPYNKSRKISDNQKQALSKKLKYISEQRNKLKPKRQLKYCSICRKGILHSNKTGLCQTCLRTTDYGKVILSEIYRAAANKSIVEGKHHGWKSRNINSFAENFWIKVLDNNSIPYKREVTARFGTKPNERYFLDFYIETSKYKLDLEIDGKQHKYMDRKQHDNLRDKRLMELGYIIYRVDWNEINTQSGKDLMKEKIDKFLSFYNNL